MTKKNIVLGMAMGYNYEQLKPFVKTLRNTGFDGDIVLFVSEKLNKKDALSLKKEDVILSFIADFDARNKFLKYRHSPKIKWIYSIFNLIFLSVFKTLGVKNAICKIGKITAFYCSVALSRYYYYLDFLIKHSHKYEYVLISDVRDVVFQSNPFEKLPEDLNLLFALENKNIHLENDASNSRWLNNLYGNEIMQKIGANIISCSGTTIGSTNGIMHYLEIMVAEIIKQGSKFPGSFGHDQGIHNYLLYTCAFSNYDFIKNEEDFILTMVTLPKENIIEKDGLIYNKKNEVVSILHQYNWHPQLKLKVLENL